MNDTNNTYRAGAAKLLSQRRIDTGRSSQSTASETSAPPTERAQLPDPTTVATSATPNGPKSLPDVAPSEQPLTLQSLPLERPLTTRQAAAILNQSVDTLKKWRQREIGPDYVRCESGAIRYLPSQISQYLNDHTVEPSSRKRRKQSLSGKPSGVRNNRVRSAL